ncbi:YybH family protein [Winogradskyella sp.]|uniref:YybH family protein n=1 Tax=Winogradskyella sp. TaxID=1883156 RepID=UPI003BAB22CB
MKTNFFLTLFFLINILTLQGQNVNNDSIANIIDSQVWEPFLDSYNKNDFTKYLSLHTNDVLRVGNWGIRTGDAFKENVIKWWSKPNRPKREMTLKFEHRLYDGNTGYEVGYYMISSADKKGDLTKYFGRFHIVLRKVDGAWKIAQDWDIDTVNGEKITEELFEKIKD